MGDVILQSPLESLRLLRRTGANVDAATNAGETVLQELVKSSHVDAVEWLRK
ncbi:hypothetical protein BKA56DRAFT_580493 [Ilyonectria sp. MPI-CAGE-AT-0026]|nr:hypothetical protein BKA56DRAFT_580493 [Ilyonectria sp. MPI-CAGE-AT-0026]